MENQFSNMSSENWKDWVTEQRQEFSQRVKSAHLTRESESSSLAWPTASVAGCVEGGVVKNVEMTSSGFKATRENGTSYGAKLRDAVETYEKQNWPTPRAGNPGSRPNGKGGKILAEEAKKNWPTPTANEDKDQSTSWETLARLDKGGRILRRIASLHLTGQPDRANPNTNGKSQGSQQWSTPQARDWKGAEGRAYKGQTKDLPAQTEAQGKLNPDWVEQLMGLPVGWTDLGSWATE
jgi:hypothetical protein